MRTATATYDFFKKNKKYIYHLKLPDEPTAHDISLAISKEIIRANNKKRVNLGHLPMYALSMTLLTQQVRINIPKGNPEPVKDAYMLANERNNEMKPIKIKCDQCYGTGKSQSPFITDYKSSLCHKCNGHGFRIYKLTNRVGVNPIKDKIPTKLIIDIDGKDKENLDFMQVYLDSLFGFHFNTVETGGGYWLISSKTYDNLDEWLYDNCRLLNPSLERKDMNKYIKDLIKLDTSSKEMIIGNKERFNQMIRDSPLYSGIGNFDIGFTLISIKNKKHTLRNSAKFKGDTLKILKGD